MDSQMLKQKFDTEWGQVRRLIAANPLTAAWIALAAGAVAGFILGR